MEGWDRTGQHGTEQGGTMKREERWSGGQQVTKAGWCTWILHFRCTGYFADLIDKKEAMPRKAPDGAPMFQVMVHSSANSYLEL